LPPEIRLDEKIWTLRRLRQRAVVVRAEGEHRDNFSGVLGDQRTNFRCGPELSRPNRLRSRSLGGCFRPMLPFGTSIGITSHVLRFGKAHVKSDRRGAAARWHRSARRSVGAPIEDALGASTRRAVGARQNGDDGAQAFEAQPAIKFSLRRYCLPYVQVDSRDVRSWAQAASPPIARSDAALSMSGLDKNILDVEVGLLNPVSYRS